jgi:hypothetical protein
VIVGEVDLIWLRESTPDEARVGSWTPVRVGSTPQLFGIKGYRIAPLDQASMKGGRLIETWYDGLLWIALFWAIAATLMAQELDPPEYDGCGIELDRAVSVGSSEDPVSLALPAWVASGEHGRLFIVSPGLGLPGVLTCAPDGTFSGPWGAGQGPGEFQGARGP